MEHECAVCAQMADLVENGTPGRLHVSKRVSEIAKMEQAKCVVDVCLLVTK